MTWQENYQVWQDYQQLDPALAQQLAEMAGDQEALENAFTKPMAFGTAGMRGLIGPGIGQMNLYTVGAAAEGLARFMDTLDDATKQRGVAISFDSRYQSREFAHHSAQVLGAHGIPSYVFDDIRPTPELSFAVRHLHTYAGIMITASHNPKQYNGFKIYGPDGGQMPPIEADKITEYVRGIENMFTVATVAEPKLRQQGLVHIVGEDLDEDYLAGVKAVSVNPKLIDEVGKDMTLIYTPLHGTGRVIGYRALKDAGYDHFTMVKEQAIADPEFPTVEHPNPEFPEAFNMAIKLGKQEGADLLVATDPDADRLGAAVRMPNGDYQLMTGNQIASVLLNYILKAKQDTGQLPADGMVVKSIVSTELATKIAEHYDVKMTNVLTGFKYIAEQIKLAEENHDHTFLFGFEESFGYLINPFVRDKDAIQSTILLAEVAAYYKQQGLTLYDGIQQLYKEYGYFKEKTTAKEFGGVDGADKMAAIMKSLRENRPTEFAGVNVETVDDYQTQVATHADGTTEKLTLPSSNVLKYWLSDGTWIAVRPSGTEPKIKFYIGTNAQTEDEATTKLNQFETALSDWVKD
ncbi:phosphomannomutase [Secundilactobacillus odoratitofui DSM 19909 = JCM 15043]|uniref:Phosphoglucomutase n=1 Tax=Secundilactobacillus odoratitofui DSM 19909 = JCM 15043 TaxID=1423776 RepID=A0A0R1LN14_9LACO|nr:phospho-sugar mutase [Secundilactobacillus odoratitofui]KRK96920.1 phosphomannomutase [Secundilactobacillus odoratitofui DSM 19909 = JCM 15043]